MKRIKEIIKRCLPRGIKFKISYLLYYLMPKTRSFTRKEKLKYLIKNYFEYRAFAQRNYSMRLKALYRRNTVKHDYGFIYTIDEKKIFMSVNPYSNGTIDYKLCLDYSILELKEKTNNQQMKDVYDEIINIILISTKDSDDKYATYLKTMIDKKANGLEEALQRVLFINQLMWQTSHRLVGFGQIDRYLDKYIGELSNDEIKEMLTRFVLTLHRDYKYKSNSLYGDTGQIFILGGNVDEHRYFSNRITYALIEVIKECKLPDPKTLLRVSKLAPRDLIELAIDSIQTGIGSPLLANDNTIIPRIQKFGYSKEESYDYVVAACWEPFPAGVSACVANGAIINYLKPLIDVLYNSEIDGMGFEELKSAYRIELINYCDEIVKQLRGFQYGEDVLSSCFMQSCVESSKLINENGAKYYNLGITTVGLPNAVDSLLSIKNIVYDEKVLTIAQLKDILIDNFKDEKILHYVKDLDLKYGKDDDQVIALTNEIIGVTNEAISKYDESNKRITFGLSSPGYISNTIGLQATPDGRKNGEPANVHISSSQAIAYTELINFASKIGLVSNCINGNVIDFIVSPSFIENNKDKFVDFIIASIQVGFYEMQMNVVDSKTLIAAKNDPSLFPNLIVRVWGFSAYFNELPDAYKDYLIERALISENVNK